MLYETLTSDGFRTKVNETYEVRLYIGSRVGYDGDFFALHAVKQVVSLYQTRSDNAMPIRFTPTTYLDSSYEEHGWELATLAYPGKLYSNEVIDDFMFKLAKHLIKKFQQKRITVVTPTLTYMFEDTDDGGRV